jgi:hypothetical protein
MGAWGTAIFSNDTSTDVRDEFVDPIGDGFDAEDATRQLVSSYGAVRPPGNWSRSCENPFTSERTGVSS